MNRRDFGKLLAELHDELRKDIEGLKTDITAAKRLKTNLQSYFDKCQALIDKITDEETGIEAYHDLASETKTKIDEIKAAAESKLTSITDALASVQSNIEEMQTAYTSFAEINDKITDDETGLEALLTSATTLESDINAAKTNAQSHLQSISTALASVKSNIEEMETAYESFTEINEKLTDDETGLEAILANATETKSEIVAVKANADTLYKEIRKFRDDAANYIKEIGGLKTTATNAVEGIQDQHKESVALKEKIEEIFNIGTRGVHANHFVKRRNQVFWISLAWIIFFFIFLAATVILAINYILPLAEALKEPGAKVGLEVFLLRLSIITPTLFGAFYSLKQFSNERRLYEKYAFKAISTYTAESSVATLARSLENHKCADKDEKIINFAVDTFINIYQEPVEPAHDRWILKGGNKLLDLTAEVNQSVGEIKKDVGKLTDNIPDNPLN